MDRMDVITTLMAAVCAAQLALPVGAQTVMLTGSAVRNAVSVPVYRSTPPVTNSSAPLLNGYTSAPPVIYRSAPPQFVEQRPVTVVRPPRRVVRTVYLRDRRTFWQRHPMVKGATIGAGVGAAAGGITGLITHRGVLRGAAIGAGTGAGVGIVRTSQIMRRHPIVRDVATGSLVGLGLGWSGSRRGSTVGKATGIGALAGLGVGLFKHLR